MATKANIISFAVVFKAAVVFMVIGAFSALLVKENKRDFMGEKPLVEF
jgi:hypothetical protein